MEKQLVKRLDQLFRIVRERIPGREIDRRPGGAIRGSGGNSRKNHPIGEIGAP